MTQEAYTLMLNSGKLILTGKRWRKFHEFTALLIFLALCSIIGCILRINKVGFSEKPLILFLTVPLLFIAWWIPYKNKELKFAEIQTPYDKKKNHELAKAVLNKFRWAIKEDTQNFIEAYTAAKMGLTWGSDMITILIDDHRIMVNSISNLEIIKNQAFFTFGKLSRNTRQMINAIADEMNNHTTKEIDVITSS